MNFKLKIAGIFAGLFGLTLLTSAISPKNTPLEVGNQAPEISISTAAGKSFLLSELRGERVVLNFWSVKDAESRIQNIRLASIAERNGEKFVGICTDSDRELALEVMRADGVDPEMQYFADASDCSMYLPQGVSTVKLDPYGILAAID